MYWLWEKGYLERARMFEAAVERGDLAMMKCLLKKGCQMNNSQIFQAAVRHGNVRNMKWLFENGCSINDLWIFKTAVDVV